MSEVLWLILSIGILTVLIGVAVVIILRKKQGKVQATNYFAFYAVGLTFIPAGIAIAIATKNPGLIGVTGLGVVYVVIGLQHKDEWPQNRKSKKSKTANIRA
jgi:predicted membrane channel-forming protein YqfA (hemolysin III family)